MVRQDPLAAFVESAIDYSRQGMNQLRRLRYWMRQRIEARATTVQTVTDELSERRELRRQRQITPFTIGETAIQPAIEVTEEPGPAPAYTYVTPMPRGLSLRETYPDVEDLTQLTPGQIVSWISQDDYQHP